jgi:hypothetical protein
MIRMPSATARLDQRIEALKAKLADLLAVPAWRQSAEFVPEKIEAVSELLACLRRDLPSR